MKLKFFTIFGLLCYLMPASILAANATAEDDYSIFLCPDDVTISCLDFENLNGNLDALGVPEYKAYCIYDLNEYVVDSTNFCNIGRLIRTWTALDVCTWQQVQCSQVVTIVPEFENWGIEFPADILLECTTLEELPSFGEPRLFGVDCEDVLVSYEDEIFESVPDACYKVVRTWKAINWCTYNINIGDRVPEVAEENLVLHDDEYNSRFDNILGFEDFDNDGDEDRSTYIVGVTDIRNTFEPYLDYYTPNYDFLLADPDGYITHKQIIKVRDSATPQLENLQDINVCIETGCTAEVILPEVSFSDCSTRLTGTWTTNITDLSAVPPGDYTATYNISDNCGNFASQSINIMVIDCAPPTAYCRDLSIDLNITQDVTIWASDFDQGSYDACSDVSLAFSPNPQDTGLVLTCNNLGFNIIQVYALDASGNFSRCEARLRVSDSNLACPFGEPGRLAGTIFTPTYQYVPNVEVYLNGAGDQMAETDPLGFYDLRNVARLNDYSIVPVMDKNMTAGVDDTDVQAIIEHVAGITLLENIYAKIAADVDRSGVIDSEDVVALRRVLGGEEHFPNNTSWRFVPKDYVFVDSLNPQQEHFPELININNLDTILTINNFFGIKIGDVNMSWTRNSNLDQTPENVSQQAVIFSEAPTVYPNPFNGSTTLRFELKKESTVRLTVTDLTGRLLLTKNIGGVEGLNETEIKNLNASGILLYQLETTEGVFSGKMLKK